MANHKHSGGSRIRRCGVLLRNLLFAALLYLFMFGLIQLVRNPKHIKGKLGIPSGLDKSGPADIIKMTKSGVKVKFAASSSLVTINPHANVFNRPKTAVTPVDGFLGPRPHVDTEADLDLLVEACRGTYLGTEKMRNVFECLRFLAQDEGSYYKLPAVADRASERNPQAAEYLESDGQGNTKERYPSGTEAESPSMSSRGICNGPIVPFHTYWTGGATWRLEIFVKSYLYTQNLACSRLYLWLDEDRVPHAVNKMMTKDPLFARFLPLVERGDIVLKSWKFPSKIPLPKQEDNTDGIGYYRSRSKPNANGETAIADGLVEDSQGQQWLVLTERQMTFLPQAVSDAVRFVVLHSYGGVYLDMDVLLLRDMRPLLIPKKHDFAERWAAHNHPGDYNTAIMSLTANSSLSSYLLRGGVRMGLNFHPRVIGRMAWKDGRDRELLMLETAAFDPIWTEFNWDRQGRCTVPCLRDYGAVFKGTEQSVRDEWESYDGGSLDHVDPSAPQAPVKMAEPFDATASQDDPTLPPRDLSRRERRALSHQRRDSASDPEPAAASATPVAPAKPISVVDGEPTDSFTPTSDEEDELRKAGVILDYEPEEDKYPPNNRTLQNFFRGAWSYHVHNQVSLGIEKHTRKRARLTVQTVDEAPRAVVVVCGDRARP